jgi:hypothetical protein
MTKATCIAKHAQPSYRFTLYKNFYPSYYDIQLQQNPETDTIAKSLAFIHLK